MPHMATYTLEDQSALLGCRDPRHPVCDACSHERRTVGTYAAGTDSAITERVCTWCGAHGVALSRLNPTDITVRRSRMARKTSGKVLLVREDGTSEQIDVSADMPKTATPSTTTQEDQMTKTATAATTATIETVNPAPKPARVSKRRAPVTTNDAPKEPVAKKNGRAKKQTPETPNQTPTPEPNQTPATVAAVLDAAKQEAPARGRRSSGAAGAAAGVTRYSNPNAWHSIENQPSLTEEQALTLADALRTDRRNYAAYHRAYKADGKEAEAAVAAKTTFDEFHAAYVSTCKGLGVLPGGF